MAGSELQRPYSGSEAQLWALCPTCRDKNAEVQSGPSAGGHEHTFVPRITEPRPAPPRRHDPPRRPRRVLRLGRATRRPASAGPSGHRRRRGRPRGELRGEGLWRADRNGRNTGAAPVPRAIVVAPRMSAYSEASKAVFRVFEETAPLVEGLSIDEAFLDVRGLTHISGSPLEIAVQLRREIKRQVGLQITVGIARTKFLAKVASGLAKPDGLLVVPPDGELAFLHLLPVERLWGVGRVTAAKLHAPGDHDRRPGRPARRALARVDARPGIGPPSARSRPQPGSEAGPDPAPAALDRRPTGARPATKIARGADDGADRPRGARRASAADGATPVPDGRAAHALRGFLPGHAFAHVG